MIRRHTKALEAAFLRVALHAKQEGKCFYCPARVIALPEGPEGSRLEHFHPRAANGKRLVLACAWCDKTKGMMHGDHFLELVRIHLEKGILTDKGRSEIRVKAKAINRRLQARHIQRLQARAAN